MNATVTDLVEKCEATESDCERWLDAERVTLRYEYASALRALGILPAPWWARDRLRERDGGTGFAKPPRW